MRRPARLPLVRVAALAGLLAVGSVAMPAAATDRVVIVHRGDTLSGIAVRHGLSVAELMAINAIANPNLIYPGQRLRLAPPQAASTTSATPKAAAKPIVHVVQSGEHLTGIAQRYGTTIAAIVKVNKIRNPSYLHVGQRLTIPGTQVVAASTAAAAPAARAPLTPVLHVVGAGETLTGIAHRYGVTIAAIVKANAIRNPSYLRTGMRLTIPGASVAVAFATTRMPPSLARLVASRAAIGRIVAAEARAQRVPVAFALAVAWQESGWQPSVVSAAGAVGVMQLTPPTADWVSRTMLHEKVRLTDARSNVRAGVRLLKHYLARYGGNRALVLAAYYQGQTAADRHGVYRITRAYIASILALERLFTP